MKDFYVFIKSLEYIERNLSDNISQEDIAAYCACSVSALQKMWKYCTGQGVMSYIKKRRFTLAARELVEGAGVLETALKYGYGSNEAFTRAFSSFWGVSPSKLAKSRSFTDLYPVLNQKYYDGGTFMKNKFDLTQLYEKMQDKKNTYVCCFDIKHLDPINKNLGRNVGDAVIRRCVERIDAALKDGMFAFRVGGDEFVVATGYGDITQAEALRKEVTAANGEKIICDGIEAEVTLHSGIMLYSDETSNPSFYDDFMKTVYDNF